MERAPEAHGFTPASQRIVLVADNQTHDVLGGTAGIYKTGVADHYTKVAIRPPRLDLYGQELLAEALRREARDGASPLVVHLGDACNVSTTTEFERFAWTMRAARGGWVMAPGNHDGYFFGNVSHTSEDSLGLWDRAADPDGGSALQRDLFVAYYLAALIAQARPESSKLATTLGVEGLWERLCGEPSDPADPALREGLTPERFRASLRGLAQKVYRAGPGEVQFDGQAPYVARIAWRIDKSRVWHSYVVQALDLSLEANEPVRMHLADTSVEWFMPKLMKAVVKGKGPGVRGRIGREALSVLKRWRGEASDGLLVIAGHHPLDDLELGSQVDLLGRDHAAQLPLYLSAHTHQGHYAVRNLLGRAQRLELNVGSILDWPVEYRDLQIWREAPSATGSTRVAVSSNRYTGEEFLQGSNELGTSTAGLETVRQVEELLEDILGLEPSFESIGQLLSKEFALREIRLELLSAYREAIEDRGAAIEASWQAGAGPPELRGKDALLAALDEEVLRLEANLSRVRRTESERLLVELDRFVESDPDRDDDDRRRYRLTQALAASRAAWVKDGKAQVAADPRQFEELSSYDLFNRPFVVPPDRTWTVMRWGLR